MLSHTRVLNLYKFKTCVFFGRKLVNLLSTSPEMIYLQKLNTYLEEDKKMLLKDKATLQREKDKLLSTFEQEKEESKKEKADLVVMYQSQLAELKISNMLLESRLTAVINMRSIFEVMLQCWRPDMSYTKASFDLANLLLNTNTKDSNVKNLNDEGKALLSNLEPDRGGKIQMSVATELTHLYHSLSKRIHYPTLSDKGILIGGDLILRTALGVAMLKLQSLKPNLGDYDITYCDENWKKISVLRGGKVFRGVDVEVVPSETSDNAQQNVKENSTEVDI